MNTDSATNPNPNTFSHKLSHVNFVNVLEPFIMHFDIHLANPIHHTFHVYMGLSMFTADRQSAA